MFLRLMMYWEHKVFSDFWYNKILTYNYVKAKCVGHWKWFLIYLYACESQLLQMMHMPITDSLYTDRIYNGKMYSTFSTKIF